MSVQRSPSQAKLLVPTATRAGAAGRAPDGMALDPYGLERVVLPVNDTGSVALGTVRSPNAPEFGFDVSTQAAGVRFPYLRYPAVLRH